MPDPIQGVNTAGAVGAAATGHTGSAKPASAAATQKAATGATTDLANVGQTEALLKTIAEAANAVPGIDQAKVAELKQAIASGAYQANPRLVAQKFIELETLLAAAEKAK